MPNKIVISNFNAILLLIYGNDVPQAVRSTLLLYADDSCILYQHKEVDEIENSLIKTLKISVTGLWIIN